MKLLGFLFFSFFLFNADENASDNTSSIAPETLICENLSGGILCNHIADGADCFIGINGDSVYASGKDC